MKIKARSRPYWRLISFGGELNVFPTEFSLERFFAVAAEPRFLSPVLLPLIRKIYPQ